MEILTIPALDDNYMYLIIDKKTNECAAVDPVKPVKMMEIVKKNQLKLGSILVTHHHWDHAGGNKELLEMDSNISCYGYDNGRIPGLNCSVKHDQSWNLGSLNIRVLFTPCHTSGHVCYFVSEGKHNAALFTGDTLFIGGCGKFFEGTPEQMYHNLNKIIPMLPGYTKIYCGHEYTVSNLTFARHIDPTNESIKDKLAWATTRRCMQQFTVPSTLEEEMTYNPFMRVNKECMKKHYKTSDEIEVMRLMREDKDKFMVTY